MAGGADGMAERAVLPFLLFFTSPRVHSPQQSCPAYVPFLARLFFLPLPTSFSFLFSSVGRTGQPKAFLTRAHREAGVRSSQVGSRIQGVPRQHRRLHEPSGLPVRSPFNVF